MKALESTITTTDGEAFTIEESRQLARLVLKRFGNNLIAATRAWRRLLQNDCTIEDFQALIRG